MIENLCKIFIREIKGKNGEALMKKDHEKTLKNPIHDKTIPIRDTYRREQKYREEKNSIVQYQLEKIDQKWLLQTKYQRAGDKQGR